jgi:hypothetical protein
MRASNQLEKKYGMTCTLVLLSVSVSVVMSIILHGHVQVGVGVLLCVEPPDNKHAVNMRASNQLKKNQHGMYLGVVVSVGVADGVHGHVHVGGGVLLCVEPPDNKHAVNMRASNRFKKKRHGMYLGVVVSVGVAGGVYVHVHVGGGVLLCVEPPDNIHAVNMRASNQFKTKKTWHVPWCCCQCCCQCWCR